MRRAIPILVLCLAPLALAAEKEGVRLPDTVTVGDKTLVLNGLGVREATVFNVNVYVAGLYLEAKTKNPADIIGSDAKAKRLDLVFVRDVDKGDITKAWREGFENNGGDMKALGSRLGQLNAWMEDLKERDVLSFTYVPDTGVTVSVKGKTKGTIGGADFARALFSIWLGPKPPNSGLKKGLLGLE
jgi:hypothetical protein